MTSRDFCYWLQGYFELNPAEGAALGPNQVACIKKHLALVFVNEIDPSMGPPEHQAELNEIHDGDKDPTGSSTSEELDKLKVEVEKLKKRPVVGGHGPGGVTYRC